jgi:leucyl aminopeptidase
MKIKSKNKNELFNIPSSIFYFHPNEIKNSYILLPVFQDTTNEEIQSILNIKESILREELFFRKKVGEIYQTSNFIFLGLGEKKKFNPDIIINSFKPLGNFLSLSGPTRITIQIPFYLEEWLLEWSHLYKENKNDPWYPSKNHPNNKEIQYFDYVYTYDLEELIKTIIYSIELGGFSLAIYKNQKNHKKNRVDIGFNVSLKEKDLSRLIHKAKSVAELTNAYRYIASLPGNILNPETYEEFAKKIIKDYKLNIKIIKDKELEKQGFFGVLSVGKGSKKSPRVIIVEYKPEKTSKQKPLLLVGKGITFDTGGISLKPAAEMHEMKYDMCGSALVLYSVVLASQLKLEYPVIGILGIAENIPDANASRPGDVYKAWNGVTVEIQNTDAEGRLVLGDILAYGSKTYSPEIILDFATLTGACIIALGHSAAGVMTASDELFKRIEKASKISLERIWRLPHWSIYDEQLKSDIADIRNIGGRPAGTITAMRFLSKFVPEHIPWAHFDIAGTAWLSNGPDYQKGATGWGLKLMEILFKTLKE